MAQLAAGVDLGAHSVKIVLARVRMRTIEIVERREVPLRRDGDGRPVGDALRRALEEATSGLAGHPQLVFSALPADSLIVRTVDIPRVAARRADAILRREVEDDVPVDMDDAVIDHVDRAIQGRPVMQSLVVVALGEVIGETLALLDGVKLDPAELGVGGADYTGLAKIAPVLASQEPVMVVDLGSRRTDIVIVEGGEAVSMRTLSVGGDDLTRALVEHYRTSFEKAEEYKLLSSWPDMASVIEPAMQRILPSVRQSMIAYSSRTGRKVERVLLAGGTSALEGIVDLFAGALQVPVALLWEEMDASAGESRSTARFLRATALVWRALAGPSDQRYDLRKGAFVFRGQARATRRRWVRAVVAILVLVFGWSFYTMARVSSLKAKEAKQRERLAVLTERYLGEEVTDFDRAEKMMASAKPVKSPLPKADAFDFISEMSRMIPEEIIHDVEQLEIKPGKVQIRGIVDTIAARDEIISRLEEYTDCVTAISKGKTTQSPKDNRQKYTLDLETECP